MATVKDALKMLKGFAPEEYGFKEEYDNIGLMCGREDAKVTKIICCLDVTEAVIDEAIAEGAELIISHHPMIYYPVKNVVADNVLGRKLLKAIENRIAIYAAHTNLDFCRDGINDYIASLMGLRNVEMIRPYLGDEAGFGRVGDLANKVFPAALKVELNAILKDDYIRVIGDTEAQVKRIAVINGGAGGDTKYVDWAMEKGADCLVTADVKHHVAMYALENGIVMIEPQHFTMEHAYITRLVQILKIEAKSKKVDAEILQATCEVNPRT